jgi:hypothetical protein
MPHKVPQVAAPQVLVPLHGNRRAEKRAGFLVRALHGSLLMKHVSMAQNYTTHTHAF